MNIKEDMLTFTAAADFLQISPEVLRRHAKTGVIPAHKEGRTWRFSRKALEAWLHDGGPQVAADVDDSPWEVSCIILFYKVVTWKRLQKFGP